MKTFSAARMLCATVALSAAALTTFAGEDSSSWKAAKPVTTFTEAKAVTPDDTVTMQCKSCKTVLVRDVKHVGPPGKGHDEWATIGSKHRCDECKGEITVVRGKTTDSMQHNCSKCGAGAVTCCVAPAMPKK